jgi:predicted dehydrogenase
MEPRTATMRKIGVGVVGLGDHALRSHVQHLAGAGAALVGVFDPDTEATAVFRGTSVAIHPSLASLLADPLVEAVIICSPDRFHADSLAEAVAAGKHVLVEKPAAAERDDLPALQLTLHAAKRNSLVVSSCHPRRFDPPFVSLKDRLEYFRTQLGEPLNVSFDFFYHRPSKAGLHHGLLIDHINHEIDLVNWMFGYSEFRATKLFDSELRYSACGVRDDGITFVFSGSRHLDRRVYAEAMEVRFERGLVRLDAEAGKLLVHDYDADATYVDLCEATNYESRFQELNDDFFTAIRNSGKPYLSAQDIIVNTETGIFLTEDGVYDSSGEE